MLTMKEQQEETLKNQLILAVKDLIKCMDLASDLNIEIVEEETSGSSFVFSLEYLPYENNRQGFRQRVSNFEVEQFIANVFENIQDLMGIEYKRDSNFVKAHIPPEEKRKYDIEVGMFSNKHGRLFFYEKVHVRILFVENR